MFFRKIIAGILTAGLLLGCSGCGTLESQLQSPGQPATSQPDVTEPVTQTTPTTDPTEYTEPEEMLPDDWDSTPPPVVQGVPMSPHHLELENLTVAPKYPSNSQCPQQEDYLFDPDQYFSDRQSWEMDQWQYHPSSPENAHDLDPFLKAATKQFLSGENNRVCSPLNVYFALAMLAETTDGNSRQQILRTLGHSDLEALRQQANQLWNAHYYNNGQTVSLFANSVWLDHAYTYHQSTLSDLGKYHYTSVFTGDLGTAQLDQQLAKWLNAQTGNFLSDYTQTTRFDPETVFALASTAYMSASWTNSFYEGGTVPKLFHAKSGDLIRDFMHMSVEHKTYYWDDDFAAVELYLTGAHQMWLILPDEWSSPQDLLQKGRCYDLIADPDGWDDRQVLTVNMSIPKFDVSSKQDLIPGLKAMGITDIFNFGKADFSSITAQPLYLKNTEHTARVAVDEEGIEAAAYTTMSYATSPPPREVEEIDFVLDRPFLFVITGTDDLPLFAGVVAEP